MRMAGAFWSAWNWTEQAIGWHDPIDFLENTPISAWNVLVNN
jgi:hypothetical protein